MRRFYRDRMLITGAFALCAVALVAFLSLLPAHLVLSAEAARVAKVTPLSADDEAERDAIVRAQRVVRSLASVATSSVPWMGSVKSALDVRPAGVAVENITFERGEEGKLTLSGSAGSREAINSYVTALRAKKEFTSVSVPLGVLAGTDGHFTITIRGSF